MSGRNDLYFTLICSVCGNKLSVVLNNNEQANFHSSIGADNAYSFETKIAVEPCKKCYEKGQKPRRLLKEILEEIDG